MGYARISIEPGFLIELLHLPEDTCILEASASNVGDALVLTVAHPDLKNASALEDIPAAKPRFRSEPARIIFEGWGQE